MKYINHKYRYNYFLAAAINSSDLEVLYYYMESPYIFGFIIKNDDQIKHLHISIEQRENKVQHKNYSKLDIFKMCFVNLIKISKYDLKRDVYAITEDTFEDLLEELTDASKEFIDNLYTGYTSSLALEMIK